MRSMASDYVREFMMASKVSIRYAPTAPLDDPIEQKLREDLLKEEAQEYQDASEANDIVEMADALADIVYVAYGNAASHGIDLDAVIREVHRSNMSKFGPNREVYYYPGSTKVAKGPDYFKPDIAGVLGIEEK